MPVLAWLALIGILHIHHEPSHDSDAPFSAVLAAAIDADLDFIVLTDHAGAAESGALPGAERAGLYPKPNGRSLRVLVGVELGTADGHLLAYAVPGLVPAEGRPGREVIDAIHRAGGFAVVPHPFDYGGWHDWSAGFDGIEVHNNAAAFRQLVGPLLPLRLLRFAVDPAGVLRGMLGRPDRELELWDRLLEQGRHVIGFSGADVHQNISVLGWKIDSYARMFRTVQTWCPAGSLDAEAVWTALRSGRCWIHYSVFEKSGEPAEVVFPSGRRELQLRNGRAVLELGQPEFE